MQKPLIFERECDTILSRTKVRSDLSIAVLDNFLPEHGAEAVRRRD